MQPHPPHILEPDAAAGPLPETVERLDPRFAYGFLALVVLALLGSFGYANARGESVRSPRPADPPPVRVADDTEALYRAWREAGVRGAVLVDASAALRFAGVMFSEDIVMEPAYPVRVVDLPEEYERRLARPNALFAASKNNMFRSIHHLMPPGDFASKVEEGRRQGYPGIAKDGKSVDACYMGQPRRIAAELPVIDEPVVLNVDASYFLSGDQETLLRLLIDARLDYRLVTADRARDDTSVTDAERLKLERFVRALREERR